MNRAIKPNKADWMGEAGRTGTHREARRLGAGIGQRAWPLTSGGRSLRRVSLSLWILALLCFVLAAFVWWELLQL